MGKKDKALILWPELQGDRRAYWQLVRKAAATVMGVKVEEIEFDESQDPPIPPAQYAEILKVSYKILDD